MATLVPVGVVICFAYIADVSPPCFPLYLSTSPAMQSSESSADHHDKHHHDHPEYLAHHFDTPEQQFDAGKLGIWLFLVTEILFFSGLFVAYAVYRAHHPEIFVWAHYHLSTFLGALNTGVLLFSSLTMALAVRAAQLGQQTALVAYIAVTILCAFAFMGVKSVEYAEKIEHGLLWPGAEVASHDEEHAHDDHHEDGEKHKEGEKHEQEHPDDDHAHAEDSHSEGAHGDEAGAPPRNARVFFSIYFCMTGLHAIHVGIGIIALTWLLIRSIQGQFGPEYYNPVDYVGLYWHLVDLIWIYLFPLLYLIH